MATTALDPGAAALDHGLWALDDAEAASGAPSGPVSAPDRSSASSAASSTDGLDHGLAVRPVDDRDAPTTLGDPPTARPPLVAALNLGQLPAATGDGAFDLALGSPTNAPGGFSFEEIMSPRHQNGKRYLGGYLQHRVSMAGGLLKSWKRKYFRLRDHGLVCFKNEDDTSPLFELRFTAQSTVLVDKPIGNDGGSGRIDTMGGSGAEVPLPVPAKGKVNSSHMLILKLVDVEGHQTPATKVDVPVYLKAESAEDFAAWIENIRLKIDVRKRALASEAVQAVVSAPSPSTTASAGASSELPLPRPRLASIGEASSVASNIGHSSLRPPSEDRSLSMRETASSRYGQSPLPDQQQPQNPQQTTPSNLLFTTGDPDPPEFQTFRSKYLLMKEIGEGSFSIVHRAVNRLNGQLCAVKCCKYSAALGEEVSILRRLKHPNIVGLEGVYNQDDMYYVVMDYMENGDLCERLIQKQRLSEPEAKVIVTQVLHGLEYLHRNHVLHRDLKPENILLHGDVVKIADFGLAKQLPNATSMLKKSCGTLEYAAPEILCGEAYGLKSDIFSLGVVLYVLLFGAFPFSIESAAALQRMNRFPDGVDVRDMSCLNRENAQWKQVSATAQDVLLRMLCKSDKDRLSAKDLLNHPWFGGSGLLSPAKSSETSFFRRGSGTLDSTSRRSSGAAADQVSATTYDQETRRLADCRTKGCIELLARGFDALKYSMKGTTSPHVTTIVVDFVHGTISWTARGGILGFSNTSSTRKVSDHNHQNGMAMTSKRGSSRLISFSDVQEIRVGHTTDAFRAVGGSSTKEMPSPELCFSIISSWRTLDIVVKANIQRAFVVDCLQRALDQYQLKHKQHSASPSDLVEIIESPNSVRI